MHYTVAEKGEKFCSIGLKIKNNKQNFITAQSGTEGASNRVFNLSERT